MFPYIFAISSTADGYVDPSSLTNQILTSPIITVLDHIETGNGSITIFFTGSLSSGEQTALNNIVSAHHGLTATTGVNPVPPSLMSFSNIITSTTTTTVSDNTSMIFIQRIELQGNAQLILSGSSRLMGVG